ncbi:MAG: hypothetical protein JXD23_13660 [Spirochaetales bacterium]|nr:hypothetical protein [Spirochaetales bacterium]
MIYWKKISDEEARRTIAAREFPDEIRASRDKVAVILTQGWCHQWLSLKHGLERVASSETREIDVHIFVYDHSPVFNEFLTFKETVLGNAVIPYIRYYRDGKYRTDSNYVTVEKFLSRFN